MREDQEDKKEEEDVKEKEKNKERKEERSSGACCDICLSLSSGLSLGGKDVGELSFIRDQEERDEVEQFSLTPTWNRSLQDAFENLFHRGVPVPSRSLSTFKELQRLSNSEDFLFKQFFRDIDGILYKIEVTAPLPSFSSSFSSSSSSSSFPSSSSRYVCGVCREACSCSSSSSSSFSASSRNQGPSHRKVSSSLSCEGYSDSPLSSRHFKSIKKGTCLDEDREACREVPVYVHPSQLLLYVSYPKYFENLWNSGGSELLLHFLGAKEQTECRLMALDRDACRYDLLIELVTLPTSPSMRSELALQLSRIRWRLQCGPLQRFFRSEASLQRSKRRDGCSSSGSKTSVLREKLKKVTLRKGEVIVLYSSNDIGVRREGVYERNEEELIEKDRKGMPVYNSLNEKKEEEKEDEQSAVRGSSPRRIIAVFFEWSLETASPLEMALAHGCVEHVVEAIRLHGLPPSLESKQRDTSMGSSLSSVFFPPQVLLPDQLPDNVRASFVKQDEGTSSKASSSPRVSLSHARDQQQEHQARESCLSSSSTTSASSFASSHPIYLRLSFDGSAVFSPSLPSTIRCARALTLSELLISLYPLVMQRLVRTQKKLFRRMAREWARPP
ncbi:hypothetical protein CSUI_001142 [Cystoisospora suis]|uniref:Uncharacterized protein n=1 Tax=Cystoisospora suis TaxID=483139 RepID=A0A2C6LBH4_9APIC|nr:hypothetical protein CSUI_001142 [Cystoisospora suis]